MSCVIVAATVVSYVYYADIFLVWYMGRDLIADGDIHLKVVRWLVQLR